MSVRVRQWSLYVSESRQCVGYLCHGCDEIWSVVGHLLRYNHNSLHVKYHLKDGILVMETYFS